MTQPTSDKNDNLDYEKEIRSIYRERNSRFFSPIGKDKTAKTFGWSGLTVILILSLLAGFTGAILVMTTWQSSLQLSLTDKPVRPAAVSLSPEFNQQTVDYFSKSVVAIFVAREVKANAGMIDRVYLWSESLGQGLVLSSDGWVVTTQAVVSNAAKDLVVSTDDGVVHGVEAIVVDSVAPLTYLKIKADNLTATAFANATSLTLGQTVLAIGKNNQSTTPSFYTRRLSNLTVKTAANRSDLVVSSEILPDRYLLDQAVPQGMAGMPISNTRGEVLGLLSKWEGEWRSVVPIGSIASIIDGLFADKQVKRASLGVFYSQASWLKAFTPADFKLAEGAILLASSKSPAVAAKSPAALAGFKEGDVILAVDNQRLDRISLSAAIQQYRPDNKIEFTVNRDGKTIKLTAQLGAQVSKNLITASVE
ncbi:MAG: S1C family serine protease [Patescibacteria group bacterium]